MNLSKFIATSFDHLNQANHSLLKDSSVIQLASNIVNQKMWFRSQMKGASKLVCKTFDLAHTDELEALNKEIYLLEKKLDEKERLIDKLTDNSEETF